MKFSVDRGRFSPFSLCFSLGQNELLSLGNLPYSIQMGSCRGMSSSLQRSGNVSWCVDSESPTSVATALTATATPEEFFPQKHQSTGSGQIPLLLLSPAEITKRTHRVAVTQSHHSHWNQHSSSALYTIDKPPNSPTEEGEAGRKGNIRPPKADNGSKEDQSLLHPEDQGFLLPRSSPVISRRHRPLSWHGGGTDTSAPSSIPSPLDQHCCLAVTSVEDLGSNPDHHSAQVQEDKKSCSVSSSLYRLLIAGLQLPISGQQGLAEAHRRQSLTSCHTSHSSGLPASTQDSKERSCSSIPEFSADTFKTSCEVEKENAHFIVVDMVLEVLEGVKWTLSSDRWTPMMDVHQHTKCKMCRHTSSAEDIHRACRHTQTCREGRPSHKNMKTSHRNTHSSYVHTHQHTQDEEEEEDRNDEAEHPPKTFSVLSTDSGFEESGVDTTLTQRDSPRNAEWLAQQLVLEFRRSWLPSNQPQHGGQSLHSSLQELPGTGNMAVSSDSLTEEIRLRTRMRGSLSWAPPRFQIIFTVQPSPRRSAIVALQHFLCAGCGTEVEPKYIKKLRYCEYLGRYFCDCCHSGSEAMIPGRVLSCWDFGRYPVSEFSKQLLDSVWHQPLFDLRCVGKTLYSRVKELDKFRELQDQLLGVKKLLKACRFSGRVMTEFEQLPAHLMEQPLVFSMEDLLRVKKGQLVLQAKALLHSSIHHVEHCELCLARGFICEFCRERDIIFPFQSDICKRCPACRACFHKHCFLEKKCPKCARIQSRKKRKDP
ncbi:protein associated with UVRAG as autophagy enhancer isoform X14 [Dicentrarchus labrax]|uniref:protein associated with UVRAG as autophagy enhancer isoform X3 n=1 Tax=Dicentrarchus labrax TaxID=13489 RepID=UPI0021F66BF6|nr:protein associated with UVRAG as autophagy enhancer isoform X3 [Dicentrarchus labrax]XP_051259213.1 protein associated with UVRAG as autophagy enhancer isoform X14 [Dicentrarchus labrax]